MIQKARRKSKKVDICKKISIADLCNRDFTVAVINLAFETAAILAVDSTLAVQIQTSNRVKEHCLWKEISFVYSVVEELKKGHLKKHSQTQQARTHGSPRTLYVLIKLHARRVIETKSCK